MAVTSTGAAFPPEPLARLFGRYLRFGLLAWGGPVAQIAMIRQEFVTEKGWVSQDRFNRTLAVYQALPGPEAHELCVHFGMMSRGRWGGFLAGLAFMLPGLTLMLAFSALYVRFGLASPIALSLLAGARPAVVALILRAVHRLGAHALTNRYLVGIGVTSAVATFLGVPFYVTLPVAGLAYLAVDRRRPWMALAAGALIVGVAGGLTLAELRSGDLPGPDPGASALATPSLTALLMAGLKAGFLSFGGAYTAIPILQGDATGSHGWMTTDQFLEGIALGSVLPAPLVIFSTFVGYLGAGLVGGLVVTAAVFLPAFGFTLVAMRHVQRAIANPRIHAFLDGVTAAVIGLIAVTGLIFLRLVVEQPLSAVIVAVALAVLYFWRSRASVPIVVLASALAGLWLFR